MSRFTTSLARILQERNLTKSELARKMDVSPATVGDYLSEEIAVTAKNLAKILRGFDETSDQGELLLAHLKDQVPPELAEMVSIASRAPDKRTGIVAEESGTPWQMAVIDSLSDLPRRQRDDIIRLIERLHADSQLRDLLNRTLDYLGDEETRLRRRQRRQLRDQAPAERDAQAK